MWTTDHFETGSAPRRAAAADVIVGFAAAICLLLAGCEKEPAAGDGAEKAPKNFFPEVTRVDYSQVKVDKPPEPMADPGPAADTWASRLRMLVAEAHADLQRCRNDYMIPFQFEKMRLRDVTWISISEMDAVCRDGDRATKKRGPHSIMQFLAKDHIGKHPALDRFIALGTDQLDHFRVVSLMTKKVGSPKIAKVTEVAKVARDRTIAAGLLLDEAAREIAGFPDDLQPDDSAEAVAKEQDFAAFTAMVVDHYGFLLDDMIDAYDRFASKSWQSPNMIKKPSLRLWVAIPTKLLQQDRPRLQQIKGASEADLKKLNAYFDRCDELLAAWKTSYARYIDDTQGEAWAERDPFRPAIVKAHKAWKKAHDGLAAH
jgi:hypothetical protein